MTEPHYTEFELGERQALLQVRSFIAKHGLKEVSDFCATRLHDLKMDAQRCRNPYCADVQVCTVCGKDELAGRRQTAPVDGSNGAAKRPTC